MRTGWIGRGAGLGRDGGLAEYMIVPSPRLTVALDGLDPVAAAPLADAGLTPYHAVRRALAQLGPGTSAIVIGVGGLGHVAVQLLKALSPRAWSPSIAARRRSSWPRMPGRTWCCRPRASKRGRCGAPRAVAAPRWSSTASAATRRSRWPRAPWRPGGHVSLVGLGGGTFPMRFGAVPLETSVIFSNWGTRAELAEVVALARDGAIAIDVERVPLAGVPAAYERLAAGATAAGWWPSRRMRLEAGSRSSPGGGSGIGEAICHRLAADGARVAALDLRLEAAQQTIDAIGDGLAVHADVSDSAAVDAALEHVERELGPIDVLVNNAGAVGAAHLARRCRCWRRSAARRSSGGVRTPLDALVRLSDDEWRRLLAVHLDGTFFCTRAAARLMAPRGAA